MKVLVTDFFTTQTGRLLAGELIDDSNADDPRYKALYDSYAPMVNWNPVDEPIRQAYFAQRSRLPTGSVLSLYTMLQIRGD